MPTTPPRTDSAPAAIPPGRRIVHFLLPFALPALPNVPADGQMPPPDMASLHGRAAEEPDSPARDPFASLDSRDLESRTAPLGPLGAMVPPRDNVAAEKARGAQAAASMTASFNALLAARKTPALDALIRRARDVSAPEPGDFPRGLPAHLWLAQQYGLPPTPADHDVPLAPFMLLADMSNGAAPEKPGKTVEHPIDAALQAPARWACIEPVHIEVTHDRLVLAHPQTLTLTAEDAMALASEVAESAAALGLRFLAPSPQRWYLGDDGRADSPLAALHGASPWRAAGRSIDIWLPHQRHPSPPAASTRTAPTSPARNAAPDGLPGNSLPGPARRSRAWMRLQNEVQMAWHAHPVNHAREARRQRAVNSIWLSGCGSAAMTALSGPFDTTYADDPAARGLALAAGRRTVPLPASWRTLTDGRAAEAASRVANQVSNQVPNSASNATSNATPSQATGETLNAVLSPSILVVLDALTLPMIEEDWHGWLEAFAAIDHDWLAPAQAALQGGTLDEIRLTLCDEYRSVTLAVVAHDRFAFWRRRTFASLLRRVDDHAALEARDF